MTISIVATNPSALPTSGRKVVRRLGRILAALDLKGAGLSVLLTDDETIRGLNRSFRGLDRPTNVLAFPDTDEAVGEAGHLGDVALSLETVAREAEAGGSDLGELLYFYLIHAVLHLAGYDHELGPEEDLRQTEATERLLGLIRRDL